MQITLRLQIAVAIALTVAALATVMPVRAHDYTLGALRITHPWSRATPPGAQAAGGFLKIQNTGTAPDRLIGGSLPLARTFEVHEMAMDGSVMKMRELPKGLLIEPGQTVELKPGSFHVMFMGLTGPLKAGEPVKGTLVFETAGTIEIEYKVEPIGAKTSTDTGDHGAHTGPVDKGSGHGGMTKATKP